VPEAQFCLLICHLLQKIAAVEIRSRYSNWTMADRNWIMDDSSWIMDDSNWIMDDSNWIMDN
jgi:hypothetical protein